jgi:hypothetical protein
MNNDLMLKADSFLRNEAFHPQDILVRECLTKGVLQYEDIINYCYHQSFDLNQMKEGPSMRPIYSWIPTSTFFADALVQHKAPVLRSVCGNWWGRTHKGLTIKDPILLEIVKKMERVK